MLSLPSLSVPILEATDVETGPMCCLIMSEQVSLSPSLIILKKLSERFIMFYLQLI